MPLTKEQLDHYIAVSWERFDIERLLETYRMSAQVMYAIGEQVAQRDREVLRGKLGDWGEYIPDKDETLPRFTKNTPYPRCIITNHIIEGEKIVQLSYDGMLPLYFLKKNVLKEKDMEIDSYLKSVENYYFRATNDALALLSSDEHPEPKTKAFLYVCHFYSDLKIRDLDNRNRSVLINAARYGRLIDGDEWEKMSYMEEGFLDIAKKNHISMFISSRKNGLKTVEYVNDLYQKGHLFRL